MPWSEIIFQSQLQCSRAVCIYRMEEGTARDTIRASTSIRDRIQRGGETSAVAGPAIAANDITAGIPKIRIVNPELGMVEDVESFRTKLKSAAFRYHEVLQKAQIKIYAVRIVQKVTARISER